MRLTRQRQLILDKLRQTKSHPTAVEVFDEVRKHISNISLGTVYRNLDVLSREGVIRKIETCGDQKRFDGMADEHLHIICSGCGRVQDVESEFDINLDKLAGLDTEYKVTGVRLEILGLCPDCNVRTG